MSKLASGQEFLSMKFILMYGAVVMLLAVYAVLWQQILRRVPLSTAYMFKGTSLIFVLLLSALFFHEGITLQNVLGSVIIVVGIIFYAKA